MPIASTNDYSPTIDTIVKDAMVMTGLMNTQQTVGDHQHKDNASYCRRRLADIVDELLASGVILRWAEFRTFLSVDGQQEYDLGADVQDVLSSLTFRPSGSQAETHIKQVREEDWLRLSNKKATGVPVLALIYRAADPLTTRLWPLPTEDDAVITYLAHVKAADVDDGSKLLDMPPYWRNYITLRVASAFALSQSKEQSGMQLLALAERQFARNLNKSQGRASVQATVGHRTGWGRARR